MKAVLLLLVVAVCLAVAIVTPERREFEEFKEKYNKKYDNEKEENLRFTHFTSNLKKNKKNEQRGWRYNLRSY